MSVPAIIHRLLSRAARQRHRQLACYGDLLLLSERPASRTGTTWSWQRDRRYVKSLERRARRTNSPQTVESWLFALSVSTCPTRFASCATGDWTEAERLARTPWQRHLVRRGAALRARINVVRDISERRQIARDSTGGKFLRRLGADNDRLRLIRFYTAIARRMLDLVQRAEPESPSATAAARGVASHERARCQRRRHAPASGPPPSRAENRPCNKGTPWWSRWFLACAQARDCQLRAGDIAPLAVTKPSLDSGCAAAAQRGVRPSTASCTRPRVAIASIRC